MVDGISWRLRLNFFSCNFLPTKIAPCEVDLISNKKDAHDFWVAHVKLPCLLHFELVPIVDIVCFILIRSWVCTHNLYIYFKGAILIGPSAIFLEHWACPQYNHLFGPPVAKYKQICTPEFHVFSLYTGELNFGHTI